MLKRTGSVVWTIAVLLTGLGLFQQLKTGVQFDTDIFELLPTVETENVPRALLKDLSERASQRNLFLIQHNLEVEEEKASRIFADELRRSDLFLQVETGLEYSSDEESFRELYTPFRYQLLEASSKMLDQSRTFLFSPGTGSFAGDLNDDPLLMIPQIAKSFSSHQPTAARTIVSAVTKEPTLSKGVHDDVVAAIERAGAKTREALPDTEILSSGIAKFAHASSNAIHNELTTIGVGSLAGLLLLTAVVFASATQMILLVLPVLVGCVVALSTTLYLFGKIHLITLAFGATLIGVSVDYSFHYLTHRALEGRRARSVIPAITLGAITSLIGYACLFIAPLPGLQQMAVFSSVGLIGAFFTVVCWFPLLTSGFNGSLRNFAPKPSRRSLGVAAIAILIGVPGLLVISADDNIKLLQHMPSQLIEEEKEARTLLNLPSSNQFFLVKGDTEEQVLQRLESFSKQIGSNAAVNLSDFVPSKQRQDSNFKSLQAIEPEVVKYLEELGFQSEVKQELISRLRSMSPNEYLSLSQFLSSSLGRKFTDLWLPEEKMAVLPLKAAKPYEQLKQLAAASEGVYLVDQVHDFSALLTAYRKRALALVIVGFAIILIIMLARFGISLGFRVAAPPIIAALFALGVNGLLGVPVNLFNTLALILVLAIGIDYTIFYAEAKEEVESTQLAIFLSACTTILSFGLLALCKTPFLYSIGLTVAAGIVVAYLLAPMARDA